MWWMTESSIAWAMLLEKLMNAQFVLEQENVRFITNMFENLVTSLHP